MIANVAFKTRLVIHAFREQFRASIMPRLECLDRCFMVERSLRNAVVVKFDVIGTSARAKSADGSGARISTRLAHLFLIPPH